MNFLQLTQKAVRLSGARLDPPTSVTAAKGLAADFFTYINDAWRDIQMERPDWYFRAAQGELNINSDVLEKGQKLTKISVPNPINRSFNFMALHDFYIVEKDNPTDIPSNLQFIPWNSYPYRTDIQLDYNENNLDPQRPRDFTVAPNGDIWLFPVPDKDYTINFNGVKRIQELCADCDEPFLPPEYSDMIVWRAIRDYAMYLQDAAMMEKARARYLPLKKSLDDEYLTRMTLDVDTLYSR